MSVRRLIAPSIALAVVLTVPGAPPARAAPGITHGIVESFDGTPIAYTLFVAEGASAATPAPIVLMTHGWGLRRERNVAGLVDTLTAAGYNVLTWDSRGFGDSGDVTHANSMDYEVRDVGALLDLVASHEAVLLDGPGDPRAGMTGASYAGGIQLLAASADNRIDAIAPQIAWNDLPRALKPGGVLRIEWDLALYGAGLSSSAIDGLDSPAGPQTGAYDPMIHQSLIEGATTNDWSPEVAAWFDERSPRHYLNGATYKGRTIPGIRAPMLAYQGTADTILTLNEAIDNYNQVRANGVDAKVIMFCGDLLTTHASHSLNPARPLICEAGNQRPFIDDAIRRWFAKHLRGEDVDTGAQFDYQTQDGAFHSIETLPSPAIEGSGVGTLVNVAASAGGVSTTAARPDGFAFEIPAAAGKTLLGLPSATFTVSAPVEFDEAYVFFKLLDVDSIGRVTVVDDQIMARKVTDIGPVPIEISMDLVGVAWAVRPGHALFVEVTSTAYDHASSRTPFVIDVSATVRVPYVS